MLLMRSIRQLTYVNHLDYPEVTTTREKPSNDIQPYYLHYRTQTYLGFLQTHIVSSLNIWGSHRIWLKAWILRYFTLSWETAYRLPLIDVCFLHISGLVNHHSPSSLTQLDIALILINVFVSEFHSKPQYSEWIFSWRALFEKIVLFLK